MGKYVPKLQETFLENLFFFDFSTKIFVLRGFFALRRYVARRSKAKVDFPDLADLISRVSVVHLEREIAL